MRNIKKILVVSSLIFVAACEVSTTGPSAIDTRGGFVSSADSAGVEQARPHRKLEPAIAH